MGPAERRPAAVDTERRTLGSWLEEDFGPEAQVLIGLCCDARGRPLYFSHVKLALATFAPRLAGSDRERRLTRAYVYLVASYYVVDGIVDGHAIHGRAVTEGTLACYVHMLTAAAAKYLIHASKDYEQSLQVSALLSAAVTENRAALRSEFDFRNQLNADWTNESFHLGARSNAFSMLLECCAIFGEFRCSVEFMGEIRELLALLQRGDDVCDWREDFERGNMTPFLRSCGASAEITVDQLEAIVYLDGAMVDELDEISKSLMRIKSRLCQQAPEGVAMEPLCAFVEVHAKKAEQKRATMSLRSEDLLDA